MDTLTPKHRSRLMAAIKGKDTEPEMVVRRLLWHKGYRYRLHEKSLPGKPDIVFWKRKKIVLVHGCFWHNHGCRKSRFPKTNIEFWKKKIITNATRDQKNLADLEAAGWKVLTVWQCELKKRNTEQLVSKLISFLENE